MSDDEAALLARSLEEVCHEQSAAECRRAHSKLLDYAGHLDKWAESVNLVSRADLPRLCSHHLIPALQLRPSLRRVPHETVLDIGSGAGLPGIPLAITLPKSRFTLVESRRRRASFLRHVVRSLPLTNVAVVHARVEDWRPDSPVMVAMARAVADPVEVAELVRHALHRQGHVLVTLPPSEVCPVSGDVTRPQVPRQARGTRHVLWQPFAGGSGRDPETVDSDVEKDG